MHERWSTLERAMSLEFGADMFGDGDESVTGLKAAAKGKKEKKKKKKKKPEKATSEGFENPLSNSEEEEDIEEAAAPVSEGVPPKKKAKPKKKKAVNEFAEAEMASSDDEDIESEIAARVQSEQLKAAVGDKGLHINKHPPSQLDFQARFSERLLVASGKKAKKASKKEKKAAAAASDMVNPMADGADDSWMEEMDASGGGAAMGEKETVGWTLGIGKHTRNPCYNLISRGRC